MKYIAFLEQEGSGCDYSIACGEAVCMIKSKTREAAVEELKSIVVGDWYEDTGEYEDGFYRELKISSALLVKVEEWECAPVEEWYKEAKDREAEARKRRVEGRVRVN